MSNILIIEDSDCISNSLEEFLQYNNLYTHSVETAEEALEYLEYNEIDLFIVDIGLEGMSGIEFIKQIEIPKNPYSAIIITSMAYDMDSINLAMKYGAFSYIYKPFELEKILEIVNEALVESDYKKTKLKNCINHNNEVIQNENYMSDIIRSLRNTQNKFEILLDCMDEGILALDTNNCIMFINKNFAKIINKKPYECFFKNLENVIEDETLFLDLQSIMFNQKNLTSQEYIIINTIQNNQIQSKYYTYNSSQIKNSENEVIGAIISLSDFTNKIEIDKARYSLLNNLVHELRTPLTSIISMTEALRDTTLSPEQSYFIDIMNECENILMNHLNRTLDFSKLERNKLKLKEKVFNVYTICKECVYIVTPFINNKPLSIVIQMKKDISVIGDSIKLKEILLNLLSNAIKFTHKGKILLNCQAKFHPSGETNLFFKVIDSGIGIPEDKREVIFKDFIQLDDGSNRKFQGSGLGLAITQKLVHLMHGSISVTENSSGGSIFSFNIKVKSAMNQITIL